jgi:pimeloyl-ACP methyl ester carboxylesterase
MATFALRLFGGLLIVMAVAMSLSRAPDRPVETLVARWGPPPSEFIDLDGQLVHLRDEGPRNDPVPIVLLHGTSASLHTWEGWVQRLRMQRRVITVDLPGFGLTGPNTSGDYRGETLARFVLALLNHLQVQHFVIGGNSLGGEVAWRSALMAPQRVQKLILVDASGLPFEPLSVPLGWRLARVPGFGWLMEHVLPRRLVQASLRDVYGDPDRVTPALVDRYQEITLREGNRAALMRRLRQLGRGADDDAEKQISGLHLPTLILWGGRDRLIPPSVGERMQALVAGSTRVVFDELGHVPQEEDPPRSLAPVLEFLGLP